MYKVVSRETGQRRPMSEQRSFRAVLGRFTTGVVLVTAHTPDGPAGMTVNSFTSVSLEPPLVALCAAYTSTTWPAIRAVGGFAVSILGAQHEELCRVFSKRGADRFTGREWAPTRAGHPMPVDALGWLDCRVITIHPVGDHELVVAEAIEGAVAGRGSPLVYHAGRFTGLVSGSAQVWPSLTDVGGDASGDDGAGGAASSTGCAPRHRTIG